MQMAATDIDLHQPRLHERGDFRASDDYSAVGRTILAKYIITMAKGGERDAKWLADSAVLYLSQKKLTRQVSETL